MATRPELNLESSFGDILKKEFGTGIPQISTVVAVVLGSLGLRENFSAGAWTVVAVLCFAAVFLYRHQIPSRLPKTTLLLIGFLISCSLLAVVIYRLTADGLPFVKWSGEHINLVSAYLSFVTTTSIACLITSYRKQERMLGRIYPGPIDDAIVTQLSSLDFYKENVKFNIHVTALKENQITFVTEYSYVVVNRADGERIWDMSYTFNPTEGRVLEARFDKDTIEVDDPHFVSGVGIKIPRIMKSRQRSDAYFKIEQRFGLRDSETYTSYHPATDLKVNVQNSVDGVRFNFDLLHFSQLDVKTNANSKSLSLSGLLPFQGVILNWTTA